MKTQTQVSVVVWSKQGCSHCQEVKNYLKENNFDYKTIDVTEHDDRREILEAKYGVRHVPVVEIGLNNRYDAVTKTGIKHLEDTLKHYRLSSV